MKPKPLAGHDALRLESFQERHRNSLVVLVFTDMVGSTDLKQRLGDREAMRLITEHHSLLRAVLAEEADGEEISCAGDSFLIAMARPSGAVRFALHAQSRLREFSRKCAREIHDRIAIHAGEVLVEEGGRDLHGIQVDICARVMSLGSGDQILLTRFAFDNARQAMRMDDLRDISHLRWISHGHYALKGWAEPIEICEVGEEGLACLQPPPDNEKARRAFQPEGEPVLGWRPALEQTVPGTRWVLREKLGEGGFGEVWLACHTSLPKRQVFKFCFREDRARSLKRELTLFRILQERAGHHPNIVGINDVFLDEPPYYLGMDHVDGANLSAWWEARGGPKAVSAAVRLDIVAQIADALQAAHDAGIIHRDIKPSNILIEEKDGGKPHAYLTDFGIGQVASNEALTGITRLGFTMTMMSAQSAEPGGTQMYMAPELVAGKIASIRSDIYSLGVILYQLVIGDLQQPVTTDWRARVPDPLLQEDLASCFAGDPEQRFAGAAQLAEALRSIEERRSERNRLDREQELREKAAYRRGMIRAAAGALAVVLLVTGLALVARQQAMRAGENFRAAQKVVDDLMILTTRTTEGEKVAPGETEKLPQLLADSAVENYREFLGRNPSDPTLRLNLAKVCLSRALIYSSLGTGGNNREKQVARDSMGESLGLLRELVSKAPDSTLYRGELASALTALARDRSGYHLVDGDEQTLAAKEALDLRRRLAAEDRGSLPAQITLADLLRDVSAANPGDEGPALLDEEIGIRRKTAGLATGAERIAALIALSSTLERQADTLAGAPRLDALREAYEILQEAGEQTGAGASLILRRLQLATLLARGERLAGNAPGAAEWVGSIEQESGALLSAGPVDPQMLEQSKLAEAEALVEAALSRSGITPQKAVHQLTTAKNIMESLGATSSASFFEPGSMERTYNSLIRIATAAGMQAHALQAARDACTYWMSVWQDAPAATASWFRLSNLQASLDLEEGAAESLDEARRLQMQILRRSNEETRELALAMASAAADPEKPPGSERVAGQAVGVLRGMLEEGHGLPPDYHAKFKAAFADPVFRNDSTVQDLLAALAKADSERPQGRSVVDVTDTEVLGRAAREESKISVKGRVARVNWTGSRSWLRVVFEGVEPGEFSAKISSDMQIQLEEKLGGRLEEMLPLLDVRMTGSLDRREGAPILQLASVDALEVVGRSMAPATGSEASVVQASDLAALQAAIGDEVLLEGDVTDVVMAKTGLSTTIRFDSGGRETALAIIFSHSEDAIEAELGGAIRPSLLGKRLRVRGLVEKYGGRTPSWRGFPQIIVRDPGQIEVVGEAAPVDAADKAYFARRVGAPVTLSGTVDQVIRPGQKTFKILLKEAGPGGIKLTVFRDEEEAFVEKLKGSPEAVLPGRKLRVSGKVSAFQDSYEVIISEPWQMDLVDSP